LPFYLWAGLVFLLICMFSDLAKYPDTFFERALNNIWCSGYIVLLNFILFEYSLPFAWRKSRTIPSKVFVTFTIVFFHLLLFSAGLYGWRLLGIQLHIYVGLARFASLDKALASQMAYSAGSVLFFGVARHIHHYINLKRATTQIRIERQAAELNYLRAQTNPHFLFNTLNNIYSLAKDKSDNAPESVLRLSKILRFMLYETAADYISAEQELKVIDDYIALEKLRYDDSLHVSFNYDSESLKQALPPLLLIPLVANAFKHGASETRDHPFVDIRLSIKNQQLLFVVINSSEPPGELTIKPNIGPSNLRRQLELLYTEFILSVQHSESVFTATLQINLTSHVYGNHPSEHTTPRRGAFDRGVSQA